MSDGKRRAKGSTPARQPLTHFLCVPLVSTASRPALQSNLEIFRRDVCYAHDGEPASVQAPAVRPIGTLHLTLGVMSLNRDRLKQAIGVLRELKLERLLQEATLPPRSWQQDINAPSKTSPAPIKQQPLIVTLKGLESMHDPKNTSILYVAPHDASDRLTNFCLALEKEFRQAGFLIATDRPLKLHATVVNTIYAKRSVFEDSAPNEPKTQVGEDGIVRPVRSTGQSGGSGHGPNANAPLKLSALQILDRYKHFVWASGVVLEKVAICEMAAKNYIDTEGRIVDVQYTTVASAPLPTS
nr:hypothetical protein B0A51_11009 [Rachicladosporium sp. CCFEE 5018]